jgi:AmiR/NasT family two-component response regulator
MNLFFTDERVMAAGDLALAQALADVATIGVLQQRAASERDLLVEQLQQALNSRLIIEQAKGVIAEHGGLTMDNAFTQLRAYSRHNRRQISQVAVALVGGEISPAHIIRFNIGRKHPTSPPA